MPSNLSPQHEPNRLNLADVLDRLAGALEQQTRTVLELKGDVGTLIGVLKQVETRLAGLEAKRSPDKPKPTTKRKAK